MRLFHPIVFFSDYFIVSKFVAGQHASCSYSELQNVRNFVVSFCAVFFLIHGQFFVSEYLERVRPHQCRLEACAASLFCREQKSDDMVDVRSKMCAHTDCTTIPSYNVKGSTVPLFCREHKSDDMVDVKNKVCAHPDCTTQPSYNVKGSQTPLFCREHKSDDMVYVCNTLEGLAVSSV